MSADPGVPPLSEGTLSGGYGGPGILLRRALEEGVDEARLGTFLALLTKTTLSVPAGLTARVRDRWRPPPPLTHAPLFVLGHYRSGTTLVHKLLAADPRLGTVDTFDLFAPFAPRVAKRLLGPPAQWILDRFGVRQGFFNDYPLRLSDPNEVEPWLLATGSEWSSYWAYLFPRRALHYLDQFVRFPEPGLRERWKPAYDHALRRATLRCGGRRLVVKDPPNTGRIRALLELWPGAVFVHVRRDPVRVLLSMKALWHTTILPRFALQEIAEETVASVVLTHYQTLMEGWAAERGAIPGGACVELRYEDLLRDPIARIADVYARLDLPRFEPARDVVQARLALDRDYLPARYPPEPELPAGWEAAIDGWRTRLGYRA